MREETIKQTLKLKIKIRGVAISNNVTHNYMFNLGYVENMRTHRSIITHL